MKGFRKCKKCKTIFHFRPSEDRRGSKRMFCSRRCFSAFPKSLESNQRRIATLKKVVHTEEWNYKVSQSKLREKNPMWKDGRSIEYSEGWNKSVRQKIKKRDGYVCKSCGAKEKLLVHHIDFTKTNHHPDNLITLCRTCHHAIHWNRRYHEEEKPKMCEVRNKE